MTGLAGSLGGAGRSGRDRHARVPSSAAGRSQPRFASRCAPGTEPGEAAAQVFATAGLATRILDRNVNRWSAAWLPGVAGATNTEIGTMNYRFADGHDAPLLGVLNFNLIRDIGLPNRLTIAALEQ